MNLFTEVGLPEYPFRIDHHLSTLFMGSCFTENIGGLLKRSMFPVSINPFGVTYNPASIGRQIEALLQKEAYVDEELEQHNGLWFSFDHYTGFSSPDKDRCLEGINNSFQVAREDFRNAKLLVLTWGTAWIYRYNPTMWSATAIRFRPISLPEAAYRSKRSSSYTATCYP